MLAAQPKTRCEGQGQVDPDCPHDAAFIGAEPISTIVTMENHDGAYYAWKRAGLRDQVLVHIDAHMDFAWMPERDPAELLEVRSLRELEEQSAGTSWWNVSGVPKDRFIHLGNYVNPAVREGIVSRFYWVVPDRFFETATQRKAVARMLANLKVANPQGLQHVTWTDRFLTAEIYGKPVTICTLSDLPVFHEKILLDIDTDFLVIDEVSSFYPYAHPRKRTPWIWPDELVARLQQRTLKTDFATIAYSVEGGYTPLGCRYLADDLACLLGDPLSQTCHRQIMPLRKHATRCQDQQRLDEAKEILGEALTLCPDDASLQYQLAELSYQQEQPEDARIHYERATTLETSYTTAYNNFGPVYFRLKRFPESEAEYRKALVFDPESADAHYGLAQLYSQRKRWDDATAHYLHAMQRRPGDGRCHLGLGYAHLRRGNWHAAENEFKQALDSEQYAPWAYYWLGRVHSKRRQWDTAWAAYKAARQRGLNHTRLNLSLAMLYLRKRNVYKAFSYFRMAVRRILAGSFVAVRRLLSEATMKFLPWRERAEFR